MAHQEERQQGHQHLAHRHTRLYSEFRVDFDVGVRRVQVVGIGHKSCLEFA